MKRVFISLSLIAILFIFTAPLQAKKVREPAVAGSWYLGDEKSLRKVVDKYFEKAKIPELEGDVVGIIAPHAGYMYSGQCAAYAFKPVVGKKFSRVIVLAPSHRAYFRGASIPNYTHYETPLGLIELDRPTCEGLLKEKLISSHAGAHRDEHSLEIELPFLQRAIGDFKLVPILVGEMTKDDYYSLGKVLKKYISEDTLLVASSDFTHYGSAYGYLPFTTDIKANLKKLDQGAIERIVARDLEGFLEYKRKTGTTICGFRPISILLAALPEDTRGHLVHYYTSGDITGDYRSSVSYAAIVFTKGAFGLSEEEKEALLGLCRYTLESFLKEGKSPMRQSRYGDGAASSPSEAGVKLTPTLKEKSGAFVTLRNAGRLRGCMGYILRDLPLYEVVINATKWAAKDPRFQVNPVTLEELESIRLEISVLNPLRKISNIEEIELGRDGVVIVKGNCQALYLPQVAPEQGWDRQTMLRHLCLKAGLSPDAWKETCEFYVFTTECFESPCKLPTRQNRYGDGAPPAASAQHSEEEKD